MPVTEGYTDLAAAGGGGGEREQETFRMTDEQNGLPGVCQAPKSRAALSPER